MRPTIRILVAALIFGMLIGGLLTWWTMTRAGEPRALAEGAAEVCFTPGEDCTGRIVRAIGEARREVLVQAYSFTSPPIARALEEAARRRVRVRIIVDDSQLTERYTEADDVRRAGVEVWVDDPPGIAHNKVMVMDGETVITGSFNFSRSAQSRNTENVFVVRDAALAARYAANWERRRSVAVPYDQAVPRASNENARDARRPANDNSRQARREAKAREGLY